MIAGLTGAILWALLWATPWHSALQPWPYLRVWLGLIVLCVPGLCLDLLLRRSRDVDLGERVPVAFVFSLAMTSLLGLAGRVAGVHLRVVDAAVLLCGSAVIACARAARVRWRHPDSPCAAVWQKALLALTLVAGASLCTSTPIGSDDFTYGAQIAAFQQLPLGFARLVYDGTTSISPRYWVALWTLTESLLAEKAGVSGLQLVQLSGPALAVLALLAIRGLALALGLSRTLALLAVVVQLTALSLLGDRLQPGRAFFGRLVDDKFLAIFVVAPVACTLLARVLVLPSRRRVASAVVAWVSLAFTHPTSLGMTAMVAVTFCLLDMAMRRSASAFVAIAVVVATTMPIAALRVLPHPQHRHLHFDVAGSDARGELTVGRTWRITTIGDGPFVGMAAGARPPALLGFGGLILAVSLWRLRTSFLARYVLAALLLPTIAAIPYTGWLLGLLVTPFHLWRTLGLTPFGLGAALLMEPLFASLSTHRKDWWRGAYAVVVLACFAAIAASSLHDTRSRRVLASHVLGWVTPASSEALVARCIGVRSRTVFDLADLRATRTVIDAATIGRPVILGDRCINDLLPSISAKAMLVSFRLPIEMLNHGDFTIDEAKRIWDTQLELLDGKLPPDAVARFLAERNVDLIVLSDPAPWADATPELVEIARNGRIRVLRVARRAGDGTST